MELKERVRKVMLDHLASKGIVLPIDPFHAPTVLGPELKPMWIKLEEAGLIQPGWSFEEFVIIAEHEHFAAVFDPRI